MKKIIIFGGSGSFGTAIIPKLLGRDYEITVFSRNEKLQFSSKQKFPGVNYVIGDIRDRSAVDSAIKGQESVILAAAMKHIDKCERQPDECLKTNVFGCQNVIDSAIENKVSKLIFLSTDKAVNPTTFYGCSKWIIELYLKSVDHKETDLIRTRYGNVFGSNGSVIEIFDRLASEGKPLTVVNPEMTRFFMTLDEATDLVLYALNYGHHGDLWVYKNKSASIRQIADLFSDDQVIIGDRCMEKNDEALLSLNELRHSISHSSYYCVNDHFSNSDYDKPLTSDNAERLTQDDLKEMLEDWRSKCRY